MVQSVARHLTPCLLMRGGTSKGAYFLASDLPDDDQERDAFLLKVMGSPDSRQIDGIGGGHPLTSKVAIIKRSSRPDADVDYLFAQVMASEARVDYGQNCGNILAGVAPFAIERRLVSVDSQLTRVRIFQENTRKIATATVQTPGGTVCYDGDQHIDGVPLPAAPILLEFADVAGSTCGALLPTGHVADVIDGIEVTCIDNGMPVVIVRASDLGIIGYESPDELSANQGLRHRVEQIRLLAGPLMNLGDVSQRTVPKMSLVAEPRSGGTISTRTFIPHQVHEAIGVFGALSVATACVLDGSVAATVSRSLTDAEKQTVSVEHPTGEFSVELRIDASSRKVLDCGLVRTARLLFIGEVVT